MKDLKKKNTVIDKIKNIILNAVYPPRCSGCGELILNGVLCEKCEKSFAPIPSPVCHKCATALRDHDTLDCTAISAEVVGAYYYGGVVRDLIIEFKSDTKKDIFDVFFSDVCDKISKEYANVNFDIAVCVPSYDRDEYNCSAVIAERLAEAFMLDFDSGTLVKYRKTEKQHLLSQSERMKNLVNSITVADGKWDYVFGKTVLLCDDVKSTGSTLDECAKALYSAGAKKVCCICIAISEYIRDISSN